MSVTKTPNGFTLDNGGQRVVVDPITRIEGHMRAEVNVDENNIITNAVSSGTMWRGLEVILKGRDPRDAWAFTQRICGVCTGTHALTSVRAVEDSLVSAFPRTPTASATSCSCRCRCTITSCISITCMRSTGSTRSMRWPPTRRRRRRCSSR